MVGTLVAFDVLVVDGEGLPLPGIEVGARYRYRASPGSWSSQITDGDGYARFEDDHPEAPNEVGLFVADEDCGTYPLVSGCHLTVEM